MKVILAIIMAAIGVYIGINLLPGLNDTVATITTPTYDTGVAGLVGVVLIVFSAMIVFIMRQLVTLESNLYRITHQIRGKLNSEMSKLIAELSRSLLDFGQCGQTRRCESFI